MKPSISSRSSGGQLAQLVRGDDRRVQRVAVQPQRVVEDRVEEEEDGDAALDADQMGRGAHRLAAHLGHQDLGPPLVDDLLERQEVTDGPPRHHSSDCP